MCKEYNGWTNYFTWDYMLWINNDEGSYYHWQEQARELSVKDLEEALKEELQEAAASLLPGASCLTDILGYAIQSINYQEIADHLKDEVQEG